MSRYDVFTAVSLIVNYDLSADAHRQRIVNWINATGGTSSAFDVTTKVSQMLLPCLTHCT